ncbi:terminase small subunit [Hyphomicrobium sp. 99]|uniref:terminase small subunit n=1 Tax=Hyphomicrobium sp. 99 TaxID=1163419 RepID=UPI0005F84E70|nr:terminase small subunit [Hyphomicrobium sp. 99]
MSELTAKQALFVREYLIDLNATQAAIRAGYSPKTASRIAHELLEKTQVREAIDAAKIERAEKTGLSAERVLLEIQRMAFYDPADLIEIARPIEDSDLDGIDCGAIIEVDGKRMVLDGISEPRDIKKLPEDVRRAIVGWGYDRNQNFVLKLADKSKALNQLARHLSLYNDKLEVNGVDALAERLARAAKREGK